MLLKTSAGDNCILLNANQGNVFIGGKGKDGDIFLFPASSPDQADANASIHLDGNSGDIVFKNADCAEEFDAEDPEALEPGTVLVIGDGGRLRQSRRAYDHRAVGIVSGAGEYRPGIVLDRKKSDIQRTTVAMMGKVLCKADASSAPIEAGDLLTTSPTAGHAMKAKDPNRSFGAVIGKALAPLKKGRGLIPVIVTLQ